MGTATLEFSLSATEKSFFAGESPILRFAIALAVYKEKAVSYGAFFVVKVVVVATRLTFLEGVIWVVMVERCYADCDN